MRKFLFIAWVTLLLATPGISYGQTTINVSNTVAMANVLRPGMNIGGNAPYGASQLFKDLNYANNGLIQGDYWQTTWRCSGTGETTTNWATRETQSSGGFPASFWVGATYTAYHTDGTVLGSGTITASTAQTSSVPVSFTLSNALSAACSAGGSVTSDDEMIVRLVNPAYNLVTPQTVLGHISGTASWSNNTNPSSANTYHSLNLAAGSSWTDYIDGTSTNYPNTVSTTPVVTLNLNGTYTMSYSGYCSGCTFSYSVVRQNTSNITYLSGTDTPSASNTWQTFSHTFTGV